MPIELSAPLHHIPLVDKIADLGVTIAAGGCLKSTAPVCSMVTEPFAVTTFPMALESNHSAPVPNWPTQYLRGPNRLPSLD